MIRNIKKIVIAVIICTISVVSAYAEVTRHPVEIKCSSDPINAKWYVLDGKSDAQFTITTEGLRTEDKNDVEKIVEISSTISSIRRTIFSNLPVFIVAGCTPSNNGADITITNSSLACKVGEGIKVKMYRPNNIDPDKYHYVGTLTVATQVKGKK